MEEFIVNILASLGGASAVTGLSLSWFGKRIVERQIEKSAEKSKFKIEAEFDRISKIQEHEFSVLPEIWTKLLTAIGGLSYITNPVKELPDLQRMEYLELEEHLNKKDWPDSIKREILQSHDKNKIYMLWVIKKSIYDTDKLWSDFHNYYLFNRIFLSHNMDECLKIIDTLGVDALSLVKVAISEIGTDWEMIKKARKIVNSDLEAEKETLSKQIQDRLHFHQVK